LDENWSEPFFGLARSLADGTAPDVGKFEALERNTQHYQDARLFKMLLADAYLAAGKRLAERSRSEGGSYDRGLLEKADENLKHAILLYDKLGDYVPAKAQLADAESAIDRLAGHLAKGDGS
jgi:hypothetical protein